MKKTNGAGHSRYQCRKGTFGLSPKCSLINNKDKLLRSLRNTDPSVDHCLTINMPKRRHTTYA